jgi:hypothetical protein
MHLTLPADVLGARVRLGALREAGLMIPSKAIEDGSKTGEI